MAVDLYALMEEAGPFGRYQVLQTVLTTGTILVGAAHTLSFMYTTVAPAPVCPTHDWNASAWREAARPLANDSTACALVLAQRQVCPEWAYDDATMSETSATKYDMVCDRAFLGPLSVTLYMCGFFFGAIGYGYVSDRFGRVPTLAVTSVHTLAAALLSAFSPDIVAYVAARGLVGLGASGMVTVALTYLPECVVPRYRGYLGMVLMLPWSVSLLVLTLLAFAIRRSTYLELALALGCLPTLAACLALKESPRWLVTRGRAEEAVAVLRWIAGANGRSIDGRLAVELAIPSSAGGEEAATSEEVGIRSLVGTPGMRRVNLMLWYTFFIISLVYYGIMTGFHGLGGWSIFVNMAISASIEFVGILGIVPLLECTHRVWLLIGGYSALSVFCFVAGAFVASPSLRFLYSITCVLARPLAATVFSATALYAVEVYPTSHRTLGLGLCNAVARLSAMLAPFIHFMNNVWPALPFVVYGFMAISVALSFLFQPETRRRKSPETVADAEEMMRQFICRRCITGKARRADDES